MAARSPRETHSPWTSGFGSRLRSHTSRPTQLLKGTSPGEACAEVGVGGSTFRGVALELGFRAPAQVPGSVLVTGVSL